MTQPHNMADTFSFQGHACADKPQEDVPNGPENLKASCVTHEQHGCIIYVCMSPCTYA